MSKTKALDDLFAEPAQPTQNTAALDALFKNDAPPPQAPVKPPVEEDKAGLGGSVALGALNAGAQGALPRTMGVLGGLDAVAPRRWDEEQPIGFTNMDMARQAWSRLKQVGRAVPALVTDEDHARDKFGEGYGKDKHSTDVLMANAVENHPVGTFAGGASAGLVAGPKTVLQALVQPAFTSVGGSGQDLNKVLSGDKDALLGQAKQTGLNLALGAAGAKYPKSTAGMQIGAAALGGYAGLSPEERLQWLLSGTTGALTSGVNALGKKSQASAAKTAFDETAPMRVRATEAEAALPLKIEERTLAADKRAETVRLAEEKLSNHVESTSPEAVIARAKAHAENLTQRHAKTVDESIAAIKGIQDADEARVQEALKAKKNIGNKAYSKDLKGVVAEAEALAGEKGKSAEVAKDTFNKIGKFDLEAQKGAYANSRKLYDDLVAKWQAKKAAEEGLNSTQAKSAEKLGGMGRRMAEAQAKYDSLIRDGIEHKVAAKQAMATAFPDADASAAGLLGNEIESLAKGVWRTKALGGEITPEAEAGISKYRDDYADASNEANANFPGKAERLAQIKAEQEAKRAEVTKQAQVDADAQRKAMLSDHEANMVGKRATDEERLMSAGESEQAKIDAAAKKLADAEAARKAASEGLKTAPDAAKEAESRRVAAERDAFMEKNARLFAKVKPETMLSKARGALEEKGLPDLDESALQALLRMTSKKNQPAFTPEPPSRDLKATLAGRHGLELVEETNGAMPSGKGADTRAGGSPKLPLHPDVEAEVRAGVPRKSDNYSHPASARAAVKAEEARKAAAIAEAAGGKTTGNPKLDAFVGKEKTRLENALDLKRRTQAVEDVKAVGATSSDLKALIELARQADPQEYLKDGGKAFSFKNAGGKLLEGTPFLGKMFDAGEPKQTFVDPSRSAPLGKAAGAYVKDRVGAGLEKATGNGVPASTKSVMGIRSILDLLDENPELTKALERGKR